MAKEKRKAEASQSQQRQPALTPNEAMVLSLLTQEFLTVAQIALRRKTSKRAVQLIRKRLIEKGYLSREASQGGGVSRSTRSTTQQLRLHAMQWKVGILWGNTEPRIIQDFMGCHINIGKGFLEIYAKEGLVFEGPDEWACMALGLQFFERLGLRLENDLGIKLIKPRSQNWQLVKSEWATEGSEVAERHVKDNAQLKVFATEDGHLWFWGDWSKKTPEHETNAKVDSVEVNKHLNDWRDFHPPTNSQLFGMLHKILELQMQTAEFQKEQSAGLAAVIKLMQPQQPPMPEPLKGRPDYFG